MFFFYSNIELRLFCLQLYRKLKKKIKLVPMNPDVSLAEKDVLKKSLFRNDDKLLIKVMSEEFKEILRTDPTTVDGEAKVVHYFDIADEWAKVKKKGTKNGHISDSASTYFYLLMTVKYQSNTDNIWMSFYEGLHRHTALLLSLTSSAFNLTKNEIKFRSLTSEFFCQQQIEHFKFDSKKPHERLSDIFDGKEKANMSHLNMGLNCSNQNSPTSKYSGNDKNITFPNAKPAIPNL